LCFFFVCFGVVVLVLVLSFHDQFTSENVIELFMFSTGFLFHGGRGSFIFFVFDVVVFVFSFLVFLFVGAHKPIGWRTNTRSALYVYGSKPNSRTSYVKDRELLVISCPHSAETLRPQVRGLSEPPMTWKALEKKQKRKP
jgi:hypothetical protein